MNLHICGYVSMHREFFFTHFIYLSATGSLFFHLAMYLGRLSVYVSLSLVWRGDLQFGCTILYKPFRCWWVVSVFLPFTVVNSSVVKSLYV